MKRLNYAAIAGSLALLLTAGCGSILGPSGGNNNPYPSSPGNYPSTQSSSIQGTVDNIDTRAQRIDVTVNAVNGRSNNPYQTSVYYDSRTQVVYQGRNYSPSNLERGDQIDVSMYYNNGQSVADTITVVADARSQGNYPSYPGGNYPPNNYPPPNSPNPSGTYPNGQTTDIVGTVNYVDTQAQRIDLTSAYMTGLRNSQSGSYSIFYDSRTTVSYQGQSYRPADLERGDQVDARVYTTGGGQYQTDAITVTRNVRQ
jgi:hypothetical protein